VRTRVAVALLAVGLVTSGTSSAAMASPERQVNSPGPHLRIERTFKVASFNALGDSHTRPGGNKCCKWAPARARTKGLINLLENKHPADLIGLQEFQSPQRTLFRDLVGSDYGVRWRRDNAVAWKRSVFSFVEAHSLRIPYFHGRLRNMPVVTLRHRVTGQKVTMISVHNPANVRGPAAHHRAEAVRRERHHVEKLRKDGRLVFLVGDFNDRREPFCAMTAKNLTSSPAGGAAAPCQPPRRVRIDWIFGTDATDWRSYQMDTSVQGKLSDHPFIFAEVHF
jgi:endonuclease/exonuclease/phosphatase family metal-dependent hydrolase